MLAPINKTFMVVFVSLIKGKGCVYILDLHLLEN